MGAADTIAPHPSTSTRGGATRDVGIDVPRHMHRYFRRPVNPHPANPPGGLQPAPPNAPRGHVPADAPAADALHRSRLAAAAAIEDAERQRLEDLHAPRSKTVGTQSLYRESEAQTVPYEPDFVVPDSMTDKQRALTERNATDGGAPELLSIRHLTFANGLPAGLAEAEHIEKMRAKRAFEASLPPLSDVSQLPLRKRLMEEWEEAEWAEREAEIARLQEERLDILRRAIDAREEKASRVAEARLRRMRDGMLSEKHKKFASIQAKRVKALRKLGKDRVASHDDGDENKGSIVDEYADYGSRKYAPNPRDGLVKHPVIDTSGYLPDGINHASLDDAGAFLESIPREAYEWDADVARTALFETGTGVNARPRVWEASKGGGREERKTDAVMDEMYEQIQREKREAARAAGEAMGSPMEPATPGAVTPGGTVAASTPKPVKSKKGPERPETPQMDPPMESESASKMHRAVVLLQSLLRGRATQNETFAGREHRRELIAELRLAETETSDEPRVDSERLERERNAGAAGAAILKVLATKDAAERDAGFERSDLAARERDAAEMDRAAARIQAIQRGRMERRRAATGKSSSSDSPAEGAKGSVDARESMPDLAGFEEGEQAMILKIQAAARGRAARRSVECIKRGESPDAWMRKSVPPPAPLPRPLTPEEEDALDVAGLTPDEKAAVAKMQMSARDLLLKGEEPARIGSMSEAEKAAVAKMQASAKLHLIRAESVASAIAEAKDIDVNPLAPQFFTRKLQATARVHLARTGAVQPEERSTPATITDSITAEAAPLTSPAPVKTAVDTPVEDHPVEDLDVATMDSDSKEKVATLQASARAHVERKAAEGGPSGSGGAGPGLARQPSRRASRRGGGLMRRDSFKRIELEGGAAPTGDASPGSPGAESPRGSFVQDDHATVVRMTPRARRNSLTGMSTLGGYPESGAPVAETYTEEDEVHIVKIQAATRGHLVRRRKSKKAETEAAELDAAAIKIQSVHRARAARKEADVLRREKAEMESAAAKIQAVHRGRAARKAMSAQSEQ